MVSVLPGGPGLFGPSFEYHMPPPPPNAAPSMPHHPYYHGHASRAAVMGTKSVHMRSQSMPEAVYLGHVLGQVPKQQQQQQQQQPQQMATAFREVPVVRPKNRHPSSSQQQQQQQQHHQPPVVVGLRRSHTNVSDLGAARRAVMPNANNGYGQYHNIHTRYWNEFELAGLLAARSRSNIAAIGLNPENVYRPSMQPHHRPHHGVSRASSFYHRDHPPAGALHAARSMGFLSSNSNSRASLALPQTQSCKDVSQPLHVDCSVEYDLGSQPKIPRDSAPLLIIHPAYQQPQLQHENRFHPYNQTTSSSFQFNTDVTSAAETASKKSSSGNGTSLASSALSSSSSASNKPPSALLSSCRYPSSVPSSKLASGRVVRHSSFLLTSKTNSNNASNLASSPQFMLHMDQQRPQRGRTMQASKSSSQLHQHQIVPTKLPQESPKPDYGTPVSAKRLSIASGRGLFHLSMPDISAEDEDQPQPMYPSRQTTHNKKAQHRHHHVTKPKARMSLGAKLEAARKLSTESKDSGTSLDSNPTADMSSPIRTVPQTIPQQQHPQQQQQHHQQQQHPPIYHHQLTQQALCDSGLGTPSSLMDQDEATNANSAMSSSINSSSNQSSNVSRWKSSMSGLMTGFFCCSSGSHSFSHPPQHQQERQDDIQHWTNDVSATVYVCAPSSARLPTTPASATKRPATTTTTSEWSIKDGSPTSIYWDETRPVSSSPFHKRWMASSTASPPSASLLSSSNSSLGVGQHQLQRRSVCRWCQSTSPGDDCRDGFCASVWNKENLMRPIHI